MVNVVCLDNYYPLQGTIRADFTDKTLQRLKPILPNVGITRVANITGLDSVGIAVATCIRPNAKHLSVSQGKGLSQQLAEISAIMEALEAYHMENALGPALAGSYAALCNIHKLINPDFFNRTQFTQKKLDTLELGWVSALDLPTNTNFYIPHILTCLDSTQPHPEYSFLSVSTNGLAAGNTHEEAICHALYELIERDSLYQWQQLDQEIKNKKLLSQASIQDSNIQLLTHLHLAGLRVKIWDIASPLGIPAFHCAIYDINLFRSLGLFTGTGAHLSKEVALSRALTEAAQARLTLISGNRDDVFPEYYQRQRMLNQLLEEDWLKDGMHDYAKGVQPEYQSSFAENIKQIIVLLYRKDYRHVLLVNHTKKEIGIPVVQVLVPGLKFNGARM